MKGAGFQHSEAFLQWIWENLLFDFSRLKTACGKPLQIISAGKANRSNGPDFKNAVIDVNGITWHGDIELHVKSKNWYSHRHHQDENFNRTILHVVAEHQPVEVFCRNGSRPFTLNLLPFLSEELHVFLQAFNQQDGLPCAASVHSLSENVFLRQIEKAHKEYLEKKASDFLLHYKADELLSKAWKHALIISLWDGLGISLNRKPMAALAESFLQSPPKNLTDALHTAYTLAGFSDGASPSFDFQWNTKSVRPANHPKLRIKQAVPLSMAILDEPFSNFLKDQSPDLWKQWLMRYGINNSGRFQVLYGTVYLPALYVLGKLLSHQKLCNRVFEKWKHLKTPVPPSLLSPFKSLPVTTPVYKKKLGSVHQLKSYCEAGRCSECFVLKKAILS